jgi:AraC family transcriptional regulator of adaptative response/methylated-DNA-[protein]-cysteine methyltransferase
LDATYAAGLSSPGRLHDLFVSVEAMTPGEFKDGGRDLTIRYGVQPSPFGDCLLAVTDRGVCGLSFINGDGVVGEVAQLRRLWPNATLVEDANATAAVAARIFATPDPLQHQVTEPVRLLLAGTNFQIRVWEALLRIPSGAVTTYAGVAQAIGQPSAARAVGSAVGANHIAYLIPCHRVIRNNGIVRDYRWGPIRKKAMLGWESAHAGAAD